jgi:O-antigen/teichoic acid export membrane protein
LILPGPVLRIFGGKFGAGRNALLILIAGMLVPVCVGTVGFILIMVGRTGWDLMVYAAAFVIDVTVAFFLARPDRLGIEGAALAQACTLSFSAVARLLFVRRFVHIWPFDRHFLRLLPAAAAGGVAMWAAHQVLSGPKWLIDLGGSIAVGTLVYGGVLLAVGLKPAERRAVLAMVRGILGRPA